MYSGENASLSKGKSLSLLGFVLANMKIHMCQLDHLKAYILINFARTCLELPYIRHYNLIPQSETL